jgi:hypothetical protein
MSHPERFKNTGAAGRPPAFGFRKSISVLL